MTVKVTTLPYIPPRKVRRQENLRTVVQWVDGGIVYTSWFKRDTAACQFLNKLLDAGLDARVLMK